MAKTQDQADGQNNEVPNGEEVVGTGNSARLKFMDEINDRNDAQLADQGDLADVNDDGTTTAFAKPETKTDEQVTQEELARAAEEANQQTPKDEPSVIKHKIKVNGKDMELTTEELIARAQKIEAADEYLKDAKEKLREAEAEKTKRILEAMPKPSEPTDVSPNADEEERALVRAIQMGTEDEARAALKKFRASNNPSVNPDDIARTIDERITFNDAVARFQKEFEDLASDPVLLNIVVARDKDLLAQGDKRTYWERYQAVGNEVRAWRDTIAKPAQAAEQPKPESDKQQRKASAPAVPKGASTKAPAPTDEEDGEESASEIIAAIAKARGGPQWLRG